MTVLTMAACFIGGFALLAYQMWRKRSGWQGVGTITQVAPPIGRTCTVQVVYEINGKQVQGMHTMLGADAAIARKKIGQPVKISVNKKDPIDVHIYGGRLFYFYGFSLLFFGCLGVAVLYLVG